MIGLFVPRDTQHSPPYTTLVSWILVELSIQQIPTRVIAFPRPHESLFVFTFSFLKLHVRVVNVLNGRRDYPPASHACFPGNRINCISLHVVLLIFIQYLLGCSSICLKFGFTLVQLSEKIQKNIIIPLILEIFRFFVFLFFMSIMLYWSWIKTNFQSSVENNSGSPCFCVISLFDCLSISQTRNWSKSLLGHSCLLLWVTIEVVWSLSERGDGRRKHPRDVALRANKREDC